MSKKPSIAVGSTILANFVLNSDSDISEDLLGVEKLKNSALAILTLYIPLSSNLTV